MHFFIKFFSLVICSLRMKSISSFEIGLSNPLNPSQANPNIKSHPPSRPDMGILLPLSANDLPPDLDLKPARNKGL
jgi:hypothetical protein